MGIIRAGIGAVAGSLSDQWEDVVEAYDMGAQTLFTEGRINHKNRSFSNRATIVSNGSVVHVYDNQFMLMTDGGKVIDFTGEPGYFVVDNSSEPSMFQGQVKESLKSAWERFKFGGQSPKEQRVFFLNLSEVRDIKFGTRNAVNYFDSFYNAELFLRAFGTYSIRITNPLLFYANMVPRNSSHVEAEDIMEQLRDEFMQALQSSINNMSADGIRISYVSGKSMELSKYMSDVLDEEWTKNRGIEIVSVAIASVSYDEESKKLINMRNQGAMMQDPTIREGYVQSQIADGLRAAGSNSAGAAQAFMGMGFGMQGAGSFMQSASQTNYGQMQMNAGGAGAGQQNTGAAAAQTGAPAGGGRARKQPGQWFCPECGALNSGKFCTECGTKKPE